MIHIQPRNLRGIIAVALVLAAVFIWLMWADSRPKKNYASRSGRITFFDKHYENLPLRDVGKYRYLKLDNYVYPFEMYIDEENGSHDPKYALVDNLQPGDSIIAYYYETEHTKESGVNRFLQYIDKGKVQIYKRGNATQVLGTIMLGVCGLLIIFAIEFYKRKKIEY